jgi:formylglycine-generating enzyme required for sulfatase activity
LPSEVEWEYACRGGATSEQECSYHFYFAEPTNDLSSEQANFDGKHPFGKADKGPYLGRTTKVGSYAPNKLGLYDMHGNVWQWCEDLYDPKGTARVLRGSCWVILGENCQSAFRDRREPDYRDILLGFRLAAVPTGTDVPQEPAALPFRQGFGPGGQKHRGPPGVSSTCERSG